VRLEERSEFPRNAQESASELEAKTLASEDFEEEVDAGEPIEILIDGTLDLHTFRPREVKTLVPEYLEACRERGILQVRIVHGKGTGALRRTVHAILEQLPQVISFRLGGTGGGGWGATLVFLEPQKSPGTADRADS
jgi:DNA-nicking Smr family endonuclease